MRYSDGCLFISAFINGIHLERKPNGLSEGLSLIINLTQHRITFVEKLSEGLSRSGLASGASLWGDYLDCFN